MSLQKLLTTGFASVLIALLSVGVASAQQQWGDLKGRFIYDGPIPVPAPLNVAAAGPGICVPNPVDERVVVGAKGGVQGIIVYLRPAMGQQVAVHPDYKATEKDTIVLDNKNCRFEPHVVAIRTTQTLKLNNSDPMPHNSKYDPQNNAGGNPLIAPGMFVNLNPNANENLPFEVTCNIHGWMKSWVIVRDNPYFAVTDADGKFEIKDIPAGTFDFQLWQESAGYLQEATIGGKQTTIARGRLNQKIATGANDLGDIKLDPKVFK